MSPAVASCQDFKDTVVDREDGNTEGTTTEFVDDDLGFTRLVKTASDSSGGRLVDD